VPLDLEPEEEEGGLLEEEGLSASGPSATISPSDSALIGVARGDIEEERGGEKDAEELLPLTNFRRTLSGLRSPRRTGREVVREDPVLASSIGHTCTAFPIRRQISHATCHKGGG
jgi:hypothetical protein